MIYVVADVWRRPHPLPTNGGHVPRYFFHLADGHRERDTDGTELATLDMAVLEAVRFSGAVLAESPELLGKDECFRIEVNDDVDAPLFAVVTRVMEMPKPAQEDY